MIALQAPSTRGQMIRFAIVGVVSNLALYLLYLLLTRNGLPPVAAMSLAYALGVTQGFIFNRAWTFAHAGRRGAAFARYLVVYAAGYLLNLLALRLFVEGVGWPHAAVQAGALLVVAGLVFLLQRHWVFKAAST